MANMDKTEYIDNLNGKHLYKDFSRNIEKDHFVYLSTLDKEGFEDYILYLNDRSPLCHNSKMSVISVSGNVPIAYMCLYCTRVLRLPEYRP